MTVAANNDAELVCETLAGNREAFERIVSRYQSLVCSLAYSATGNLGESEDLAQETFITAWKHLGHLRERHKLRSWLCGIARNRINSFLRREGREPLREAESLETAAESHSAEPAPAEQAISREEEAILWRSLEKIPATYREPLILFYREQQSAARVAEALEISEDTVHQRLSRGRKLLQQEILGFVEGALTRTNPDKAFTAGVLAALPVNLAATAKAAVLGAGVAKGGLAAKTATAMGILGVIFSPLLILFGNYASYRMSLAEARSDEDRHQIRGMYSRALRLALVFYLVFAAVFTAICYHQCDYSNLFSLLVCGLFVIYVVTVCGYAAVSSRRRKEYLAGLAAQSGPDQADRPVWEYRSRATLFGLPLVHIRAGDRFALIKPPVKAWIAVGEHAMGGLFAFGAVAIAPFSIGGCAIGLLPFGGIAIGLLAMGGLGIGVFATGAIVIGWQTMGGFAFAWHAAMGGALALARDFALGGLAHAAHANNDMARQFCHDSAFFNFCRTVNRYSFWVNLIWVLPMLLWWRVVAVIRRRETSRLA